MITIYELFRNQIRHAKIDQKLTNTDIAKKSGLSKSTVAAFMCGARETDRTANAIAKALHIEI